MDAIIELIFLPLYGKANHKELAEDVLAYEVELNFFLQFFGFSKTKTIGTMMIVQL